MRNIIVTCGDVNGIGVEIALKAFKRLEEKNFSEKIVFVVPENILEKAERVLNIRLPRDFVTPYFIDETELEIGYPTLQSGKTAFRAIATALDLINENKGAALVTAPISKEAFALAGIKYKGHTDLLADFTHTANYLMTFISEKFKTALATIHVPLSEVSKLISFDMLYDGIKLLEKTAREKFASERPKIAVLGLNPHAGENGNIGTEEVNVIEPVIKRLVEEGVNVEGAFVPDAFFANRKYENYDFVFGMYHDQVLIPFKMLAFDAGVNFTAGLPFVRTSPDHGTAYDIAWKGIANENSMLASILLAEKLSRNSNAKS